MAETVAGFPFWELGFDKDGKPVSSAALDTFLRETAAQGLTDLFVFSHGWNNDPKTARDLYLRFFTEVRKLLDNPQLPKHRQAKVGTAAVVLFNFFCVMSCSTNCRPRNRSRPLS